jgi:two-component system response regulator AtoC
MSMPENSTTIIILEEQPRSCAPVRLALEKLGYAVETAEDVNDVISRTATPRLRPFAIFVDFALPYNESIVTLKNLRSADPTVPIIMLAAAPSPVDIVMAMKNGATDLVLQPVVEEELRIALGRALDNQPAVTAKCFPAIPAPQSERFTSGDSRMREIELLTETLGRAETPVLIQGETGTGKEVYARRLHACSSRAGKIFLKLNCAALPSELVESELFGYERGAFTGAMQRKPGMFELADGGTLLLDEIGDMDVRLQAKLLQVLQDNEFQRIGGKTVRVDVRILAATHRNLEEAIVEGTFREDLYYRLNVVTMELPPLRERTEDILPLAWHLIHKHAIAGRPLPVITPHLQEALIQYPWPGNIRELENAIRKLIILRDPNLLAHELLERATRKILGASPRIPPATAAMSVGSNLRTMDEVNRSRREAESDVILEALESTRWNRKRAADLLKIDYKALLYKMKKLGLDEGQTATAAHSS